MATVSTTALSVDKPGHKGCKVDSMKKRRTTLFPDNFEESFGDDKVIFMVVEAHRTLESRPIQKFSSGSKYLGQWNKLGIAGKGVYKYPHGVIYDGHFNENGEFHGTGVLVYPNGQRIEGIWRNGKLGDDVNFVTTDGVGTTKNYCSMPDRRFQIELEQDLNPPGQEFLTDEIPPPRLIPDNCYDLVEGYYDPKVKIVYAYPNKGKLVGKTQRTAKELLIKKRSIKYSYRDEDHDSRIEQISEQTVSEVDFTELMSRQMYEHPKVVSWIPLPLETYWIVKNCRKAWDANVGYRPDLYEDWTKGYSGPACEIQKNHKSNIPEFLIRNDTIKPSTKRLRSISGERVQTFIRNWLLTQELLAMEYLAKKNKPPSLLTKDLGCEDVIAARRN